MYTNFFVQPLQFEFQLIDRAIFRYFWKREIRVSFPERGKKFAKVHNVFSLLDFSFPNFSQSIKLSRKRNRERERERERERT